MRRIDQSTVISPELPSDRDASSMRRVSRRRLAVFLTTFLICLGAGMVWDLSRSPVYAARASLLTVAPPDVDQQKVEVDLQHVTIQQQKLLGRPLLERVREAMSSGSPELDLPSVEEMRAMLTVSIVPETNLVEMVARGGQPLLLSQLVNRWIEAYLEAREEEVAALDARTVDVLDRQHKALAKKIEEKRAAIDAFRGANQILSTERDENQVLARLKGLNQSLNTANEEMVKAEAKLDAIRSAIARGEVVVPEDEKRSYAGMVRRAQELREQVAEMNRRYTKTYIARDPSMKVIPEKLAKLEAKIAQSGRKGQSYVLTTARQEFLAGKETVDALRRQLDDFRAEASEFTARFGEYQAMQEDLAKMEELYREMGERLIKVQVTNRAEYPQLKVVDWAYAPSEPEWPHYWRDAAMVAGVSLLIAMLAVMLVDFLKPIPVAGRSGQVDISIYPGAAALGQADVMSPALGEERQRALPQLNVRSLVLEEVARLFEYADNVTRQLIGLLLSGLTAKDICALSAEDIDLQRCEVTLKTSPARQVRLPPDVAALFDRDGHPYLAWEGQDDFDAAEIDARIQLAAHGAELDGAEEMNASALRMTYLLFLVRQGLQLGALPAIAGEVPAKIQLELAKFSPSKAAKTPAEIDIVYPLFA